MTPVRVHESPSRVAVTAEYSVGHYTSRLTAIDHLLGDGDFAAARLARTVADRETVDPLGAPYAV